jgi:antiviral helicase SKI2
MDEILKLGKAYMVSNRVAAVANLWHSHVHLQAQDHLLGVVVKVTSASMKQYIVLVLKPDAPSVSSNLQDKKSADFQQGYVLMPKSKRSFDEEYLPSLTNRKGSGTIKIELPYQGVAAGINYEVRGIESKEFLCICNRKITIDQVRLLQDGSNAAFSKTVQQLLETKSDGNKYPPALDPLKGKAFFVKIIFNLSGEDELHNL